jgi:SNF2 family DNA or RNA helicase
VQTVFFVLKQSERGVYLEVCNDKLVEIKVNYLQYSGATRNLLRALDKIAERNAFVIDWENNDSSTIYLDTEDYLLSMLQKCDNVVNAKGEKIKIWESAAKVSVSLSENILEKETLYEGKVSVMHQGKIYKNVVPVNEYYVMAGTNIFEMEGMGDGYSMLRNFETTISEKDLSLYLSLFFSNLNQIELSFKDYKVEYDYANVLTPKPTLIFEKIDVDNALHLRVSQTLAEVGHEVLENFELSYWAELNDMERVIRVRPFMQFATESLKQDLEKRLAKHVQKKSDENIFVDGNVYIIPPEIASKLIYNDLVDLLSLYEVLGAEKLKSYKVVAIQPTIDLNLKHNIDFFEGDVTLDFGGEKMNLFDVISQYNKQKYIKLASGNNALLNDAYIKKLERLFQKKEKKARLSFFDMPLIEELISEKVTENKVFAKSREFYEGFNQLKKKRVKLADVQAELRPYQKEGVKWLNYLHENKFAGCLADDMGLGKTLQTITLLSHFYPKETKPSLIVMPKSLLFNWEKEVKKFSPKLTTYTFYGNTREMEEAKKANLIFTTYAIMRNEIERFKEEEFFYVILDESQNIKNVNAQTTKAVMLLNGNHRLALSGTPIENHLGELYSLFRFLNPNMFGTLNRFSEDYLNPIQKHNDKDAAHQLRKKIFPFILRRLKKDVLTELPDKMEQILYVEMSEEQKKMYEMRRMFYKVAIEQQISKEGVEKSKFFIFQAFNELRQIATIPENLSDGKVASAKLELLMEQLEDCIANGHKALVFVNYLNAIELIGEKLEEIGIPYVSMSGATRDREALVNRFQYDTNCKVFIATLKTGGTGLNLTAADTIFIFDPWWNVAVENQAIDRAHRIGQQNKVIAYKLITQGTIEEKIMQLQDLKRELFDNVISSDASSLKTLSQEDIDFILGS